MIESPLGFVSIYVESFSTCKFVGVRFIVLHIKIQRRFNLSHFYMTKSRPFCTQRFDCAQHYSRYFLALLCRSCWVKLVVCLVLVANNKCRLLACSECHLSSTTLYQFWYSTSLSLYGALFWLMPCRFASDTSCLLAPNLNNMWSVSQSQKYWRSFTLYLSRRIL